ncbi:MAG: hypothetical protein AAGG72_03220 [Pseudomonadota bacterium]
MDGFVDTPVASDSNSADVMQNNRRVNERRAHKAAIEALKSRDNTTNIRHIVHVYAVIIGTIALTVVYFEFGASLALGWWWSAPVVLIAVAVMGASQHQLGGTTQSDTNSLKRRLANSV